LFRVVAGGRCSLTLTRVNAIRDGLLGTAQFSAGLGDGW
jgi:hypothetical protein